MPLTHHNGLHQRRCRRPRCEGKILGIEEAAVQVAVPDDEWLYRAF